MGIYARFVLPRLTHLAMGQAQLRPYRARVVAGAKGRVLEIGIGSARNWPFYTDAVDEVVGVDPPIVAIGRRVLAGSLGDEDLEGQLSQGSRRRDDQMGAIDQVLDPTEHALVKRMSPWPARPPTEIGRGLPNAA